MTSSISTLRDDRAIMSSLDIRLVVARRVRTSDLAWSSIYLLEEFHERNLVFVILSHRLVSPLILSSTNFFITDDPRTSLLKTLSSISFGVISYVISLSKYVSSDMKMFRGESPCTRQICDNLFLAHQCSVIQAVMFSVDLLWATLSQSLQKCAKVQVWSTHTEI